MKKDIKLIFRENMELEKQKLLEQNPDIKFFSISRVNNYNTCPRQYYHTYVAKPRPEAKPGIYGILGTACHSDLENVYEQRTVTLERKNFDTEWMKCQLFNVRFPTSTIETNYMKDIDAFYKLYQPMKGEFISELGFLLKIDETHYLMGYIDLLEMREDGTVSIYDFKTSAMFKDKKLQEAGRQLCIYQMALEQLYGLETVSNGWIMLKYADVQVGTNKVKTVNCREWVAKASSQIKTLMKKNGIDADKADILLAMCEKENNIDMLPDIIKEQIKVNIHFKPYNITEEIKKETMEYITTTIAEIEEVGQDSQEYWLMKQNDFFCKNLCGFYNTYCEPFYMLV